MADRNTRKKRNTFLQRMVTALLTIALALLLALGVYVFSVWFTDHTERQRMEQEALNSIVYATENSGIGRDEAQSLIREGIEEEKPPIVAVDEEYVENHGVMLPTIRETTEIKSTCALLIERTSGQVIFSRDADRSTYPASLTKVMTAVLGMELHTNMDDLITITDEMLSGLLEANASVVGFTLGEEVPYIDLLHGLLLPSGADAANAIAITCAGSVDEFVRLMNEKAKALDMRSTNFTNVHGLHDVKMRTTAEDMAKLFDYALDFDTFRDIIGKRFHTTAGTNNHPDGITFYSTMFSMIEEPELANGAVIRGGKTGTTTPAGQCLASYCTLEDREFILVTLGAFGYSSEEKYNAADAILLYGKIKLQ